MSVCFWNLLRLFCTKVTFYLPAFIIALNPSIITTNVLNSLTNAFYVCCFVRLIFTRPRFIFKQHFLWDVTKSAFSWFSHFWRFLRLAQACTTFFKYLEATSKLRMPRGRHEASSILKGAHNHYKPPSEIFSPLRTGTWNLGFHIIFRAQHL